MAWVVDTCVLLDIGMEDPAFARASLRLLMQKSRDGLVVCPVTFVELSPAFAGQVSALEDFLMNLQIDCREDWRWEDTSRASALWSGYVQKRRQARATKRPIADILIAAFAGRFDGLITRNGPDFSAVDANLRIIQP